MGLIRCGVSTPQTVTLTGSGFPFGAFVMVHAPQATMGVRVTPSSASTTTIVFDYVFSQCGTYQVFVTDASGACDDTPSASFTIPTTPLPAATAAPLTFGALTQMAQHRLGDDTGAIWSADDVAGNLVDGYIWLATTLPLFWDWLYLESLPDGSGTIPATRQLPRTLTALDRCLWDTRVIEALEPRSYSTLDSRYEINRGEVYGYTWQKDGLRTVRLIRAPADIGDTYPVSGTWGILRDPTLLQAGSTSGTWGLPRQIPGWHPLGPDLFGVPRRPYAEGKNVRVEHFRLGRPMVGPGDVCELPPRYARYLLDYAASILLDQPGPGYDAALAQHYDQRWQRDVHRIMRRLTLVDTERLPVLGGFGRPSVTRPPRPKLPWAYGSVVR